MSMNFVGKLADSFETDMPEHYSVMKTEIYKTQGGYWYVFYHKDKYKRNAVFKRVAHSTRAAPKLISKERLYKIIEHYAIGNYDMAAAARRDRRMMFKEDYAALRGKKVVTAKRDGNLKQIYMRINKIGNATQIPFVDGITELGKAGNLLGHKFYIVMYSPGQGLKESVHGIYGDKNAAIRAYNGDMFRQTHHRYMYEAIAGNTSHLVAIKEDFYKPRYEYYTDAPNRGDPPEEYIDEWMDSLCDLDKVILKLMFISPDVAKEIVLTPNIEKQKTAPYKVKLYYYKNWDKISKDYLRRIQFGEYKIADGVI